MSDHPTETVFLYDPSWWDGQDELPLSEVEMQLLTDLTRRLWERMRHTETFQVDLRTVHGTEVRILFNPKELDTAWVIKKEAK